MQVILQGSLRQFPAAELLSFLCRRGQNGTLDCEDAGRRTRILFESDKLVWAESNKVSDPVDAILDTFEWTSGSFTLLDSVSIPQNVTRLDMTLEALHEEAKKRIGAYREDTLFRVVESPAQQQVSLSGDEFKVLFRLGGGRTLMDLAADLGVDRKELAESLEKLEKLGLILSSREQGAAAPQTSAPTPAAKPAKAAKPAPAPPQPAAEPPAPERKHPFEPKTGPIPVQEEAEVTRIEREVIKRNTQTPKTVARKKTLVGSLTPDGDPDSVYPLLDAECVLGRDAANAVSIQDGSVSSHHARIKRTPDGFVVEDLKSRNGTFVNGEKVDQPRVLADGDLIRIGKILLTFNLAQEAVAEPKTQMMQME
jgi:hypothetical protein